MLCENYEKDCKRTYMSYIRIKERVVCGLYERVQISVVRELRKELC
jgi:hypothetical protein